MAILPGQTTKTAATRSADLQRILQIRVPMIVKLAERKISLQEVLRLGNGSIIEFYKSADEALEVLINNKPIGTGVAVKVGENFGIRLTHIGDVKQLVSALGPE